MTTNKKYACLEFRQYETIYLANDVNNQYVKLAPKDWDEKVKRVWTLNLHHPIKRNEWLLGVPSVQNTLVALSKLHNWDPIRTVFQFIVIKDVIYVNPYFKGLLNNIFYGKDCIVPDFTLKSTKLYIEQKIKMLGGTIVEKSTNGKVDIIILPKNSSKSFNKTYFNFVGDIIFKDIISLPTLNSTFSLVYGEYNY